MLPVQNAMAFNSGTLNLSNYINLYEEYTYGGQTYYNYHSYPITYPSYGVGPATDYNTNGGLIEHIKYGAILVN